MDLCYNGGDITAVSNAGGIAGLTMGAWTYEDDQSGTMAGDGYFIHFKDDGVVWSYVTSCVSEGDITATGDNEVDDNLDGSAGGITGLSFYTRLWGAVSGGTVSAPATGGAASGISGQMHPYFYPFPVGDNAGHYPPEFWSENYPPYLYGMRAALSAAVLSGKHTHYTSLPSEAMRKGEGDMCDRAFGFVKGTDTSSLDTNFAVLEYSTGSATAIQTYIKNTKSSFENKIANLLTPEGDVLPYFEGMTHLDGSENKFVMGNKTYGESLTPATAQNVVKVEYQGEDGAWFSTVGAVLDAGEHTARATFVDGSTETDRFTISPSAVVLTDAADTELEYNGRTLTVRSPRIQNLIPGDDVELVVTGNQEKAPGTYTLTVTGLTGDDAGNYQLGSASGYTMDWSITITNQTPATIQLVDGNGQPLTEVGIYWNLENDRDHLTLGKDVVAQVRDENGFEYILRGGEEIQWTFTRIEGEEGCCKLEGDTLTAYYGTGSGTLTATLGELKAELKVTAGKFETISGISPGGVADYVRLGQAYDLSAIPLSATAYGGAPYTLTQAQKDSIQWSLVSGNGYNTGVEASFDEDKKTLTVTKAGLDENLEGTVTLVGTLTDNGAGEAVTTNYVTLTVRQASKAATLSVELLQGAAGITMSPNDSKPITNYLAVTCTDQYGDPFPMDMLSWTSGNEDVVSIVAGQFLRSGSEDGTTTIYATVGDGVESQEIQVTVAGTPRLTAIQITGAPQRMLTGDTLDLDTLKILCLDQCGEEIAYSGQAAWAVENVSGAGAAIANRTLRAGESAGTFNLTAAINADISHYVTIMVVEAKVDGLSLSRTSLGSRGGSVTVTLTGESLPESVTLGLFAANAAEPVVTAESNAVEDDAESGTERAVSLAVPANTSTEAAVNYTVKVSYDNGISYDTQPTANLTVAAYTGGGGGGAAAEPEQFGVTVSGSIRNGRVSVSPSQAAEGELVTITVTPNEGFVLDKLTVTGAKGEALEVTDAGGGRFTFAMPDSDVTIDTAFVEGSGQTGLPFDDVDSGDWFYEAVKYAYEIGMMSGISQVSFGPGDNLTRGMIAQILYSLDEKHASSGSTAFTDILSGAWYADAVSWAAENGLMGGYGDGLFGPEDNITREQMAQILYNYALYMGYDVSARGDLSGYRDAASTSAWARTAMEWAVGSGLFYGYDGWLNPTGTATRAEVAQILMNFCQYNAQKT